MRRLRPREAAARVMVAVIAEPYATVPAMTDLARWRRLNPLAVWAQIVVQAGPTPSQQATLVGAVTDALNRRHMRPTQLILLAAGMTGRLALDLVLAGVFPCAGIVAVDIPCTALRTPIVPTAAAVRLVVREQAMPSAPDDLLGALRASEIDERIMRLKPAGAHDAHAVASAAEAFLLELVATVSREAGNGVRSHA
jgi:hypothetical protein